MIRLIENLCAVNGVSGDEQDVAAAVIEQIRDYCEYEVTPLGDVVAFKKGAKRPRNRVMFDAHMDEVGFIVTYLSLIHIFAAVELSGRKKRRLPRIPTLRPAVRR